MLDQITLRYMTWNGPKQFDDHQNDEMFFSFYKISDKTCTYLYFM